MRFRERFARFMYGRYGLDQYGKFLVWGSVILMFVSTFFSKLFVRLIGFNVLYLIAIAGLVYGYFRIFSKNTYKRSYENDKFLKMKDKVSDWFFRNFGKNPDKRYSSNYNSYSGNTYTQEYKIFKCPSCKQKLRVPRGKGKIQITCRKCGNVFIKRS